MTARPYPVDNFRDYLLAAGLTTPDKAAVVEVDAEGVPRPLSYRELTERTDAYAAALDRLDLEVGDRVIVEAHTSGSAIAALLACATLGLPFIPVSPDTPDKRLLTIVELARPALFLAAEGGVREGLPQEVGTGVFGPGGLTVERAPAPRDRHRRRPVGTDPAYLIFTSGTTGRPKGVVMSHRANIAFYDGLHAQNVVDPDDRVAIAAPFHFDLCLGGLAMTLSRGATVVPVPRERLDWPRRFAGFLREAEVTHVQGVPSIWRMLIRHEPAELASLELVRRVFFTGEEFPLAELREFQRLLPGRRVINCYGATESMAASFTDVPEPLPDDLERLSIGHAHAGAEWTIHDEDGRPIREVGVTGQIYLRSPALFSGYWDDPEATANALVPDPLNPASGQRVLRTGDLAYRGATGELYFCGRADSQVQVRGNRVELGEVERRIQEHPRVAAAVVLLPPRADGQAELSAFVVMKPGEDPVSLVELRAFCLETLPAYMAPRDLRVLSDLPVTANGKADRKSLAERFFEAVS
ncbi:AMP-binding protein [Actinomadura macrotermitis]|uniref:Linear gramicidin synthase subunit D n=1 Tax=Actinomadura macrotermitis TaxID=2585200 RepID=A0A7K0C8M2_9ACTN|nr:AMP-binding protein [Actinomadura macrotermitis]MQY09706.1 Linear gramicidin synthase subunit D [Actinomadura macrotermitis]